MVSVMSLWMPILLSAVIVFVVSAIIHMMLPYHNSDFKKLPREDDVADALRPLDIPPGDYVMPFAGTNQERNNPAYCDKMKQGPVAMMTILPNGPMSMGSSLVLWFLFSVLVSLIAGYIAGSALPRGASYLDVFRFAGCTSFTGYAIALLHDSIWYKRNWGTTFKFVFDGLIFGLLTAGVFGWLWPR